jgi:hypothetical protein
VDGLLVGMSLFGYVRSVLNFELSLAFVLIMLRIDGGTLNRLDRLDVEAVAQMLIQERLSSETFALNANAYVDTPTDSGRHVQRCFFLSNSAVSIVSGGEDAQECMRR